MSTGTDTPGGSDLQARFERARDAIVAAGDTTIAKEQMAELEAIAEAGHAEAIIWCGVCYQFGMMVPSDVTAARHWFELGHASDIAAATFRLGDLHAGGHIQDADATTARSLFSRAIEGGNQVAACQLTFLMDHGIGGDVDRAEATAILDRSAREGFPAAQLALAERLSRGDTMATDPSAAMFWAGHAATKRYPLAADLYQSLAAAGHQPLSKVPELAIDGSLGEPLTTSTRELIDQPHVMSVSGLASISERAHLIRLAAPLIRPSRVVRSVGGAAQDRARTSGDMICQDAFCDVVIQSLVQRIAGLAGLPPSRAEPLVVLRYGEGDEYTPHFDYFDGEYTDELANGGQRVRTALGYLNTVTEGGATGFPMLGLEVPARGGHGVIFDNVRDDGTPDSRSLHAGRPIVRGQKWTATLWFREEDFPRQV
jgi:prolyl 4-hydroxylase